jgi:prephenate dehydratase
MIKISIQGARGSYHDIVARRKFPGESEIIESPTYRQVFEDVKNGLTDYGIVAIENSSYGSFLENYDSLVNYDIQIVAEAYLHIIFDLIALPGARMNEIEEVYSHPQALTDCHLFLEQHPKMRRVETDDTAGSVRMIKEHKMTKAGAIGSKLAAQIYNMNILASNIGANKKNYTRFLIISRKPEITPDADKTSLVIRAKNTSGSLFHCLKCFADEGINLSKLESRPIIGDNWQYYFYIDFERGLNEPDTQKALACLGSNTTMLRVLGSYPKCSMLEE